MKTRKGIADLSPEKALELTRKGAVLVDVRNPHEIMRVAFDIPDVLEIPLGSLETRLDEIPVKHKVILACRRGNRSLWAAQILMDHGHRRIYNLKHGIIGWEKEGLPVSKQTSGTPFSKLLQLFQKKT